MENLHEASTKSVQLRFAKELNGTIFRLEALALYSAEEVQEELETEIPEFGRWLKANDGEECFVAAPGELIQELQRIEVDVGDTVKVTRCEKSGRSDTDPYEVNVEPVDPEQNRLA